MPIRCRKIKRSYSDISDDNIKCAIIIMGLCPDIKLYVIRQMPGNIEQVIRVAKLAKQASLATKETESLLAAAIPRIERRLCQTDHLRPTFEKAHTADTHLASPLSTVRTMSETVEIPEWSTKPVLERRSRWDFNPNRRIEHFPKNESSSKTNTPEEQTFPKNKHFIKNENFRKY